MVTEYPLSGRLSLDQERVGAAQVTVLVGWPCSSVPPATLTEDGLGKVGSVAVTALDQSELMSSSPKLPMNQALIR